MIKRTWMLNAMSMTSFYLVLAILLEVAGTTSMKLSDGFNHFLPSVFIFIFYALSFVFLTLTLKRFDVSFVYAVWSGLGTLLIAMIGIVFFHEPLTVIKGASLGLIIIGIMGLRLG
jgi:small multidrug resistance pump